jgi:hypothetical protein
MAKKVNPDGTVEYGYEPELPKKKVSFGGGMSPAQKPKRVQQQKKKVVQPVEFEDPRDKEMIRRVLKRIKLSSAAWDALKEDLENKEPKDYVARRFGIKPSDLKWLRRYLGYA